MFRIQRSNSPSQKNNQCSINTLTSMQKKNQQYRKNIRRQQIEQKMKIMREEILASLSQDYYSLKNINLNEVFEKFMEFNEVEIENNWKQLEMLTNDIYVYSLSDHSDHLYFLFDEKTIHKLISLLQIDNIPLYKRNPRTYIRILWVLANYTLYSSEPLENFESIIITLFKQITSLRAFYQSKNDYKIFEHKQVRQILEMILFSISNQASNNSYLIDICFNNCQQKRFINTLIRQFQTLIAFTKENAIKNTQIPSILSKILTIFESTLKLQIQDSSTMDKIYEIDFKIMNMLLQMLVILRKQQKQPLIQYQIASIIRQFLFSHLYSKPQIITSHNFVILFQTLNSTVDKLITTTFQITNYDNMLDIEGEIKPSINTLKTKANQLEKKSIQLLESFIIIFGLNFPEDNNDQYYDIYYSWIEDHLIKIFCKIFKSTLDSFDQICYKCLQIIRNICLEQQFCEIIMEQLPIMNKVFYYIHSQAVGIRLKKSALSVLNSIICITLEGQSNLRVETIEMLKNNKILEIFAKFIGQYVDQQLNKNLLQSLLLFLSTETAEDPQDHTLWGCFCREDGIYKLQKYHNIIQNRETQHLIQTIFQAYKP